MNRIISIFWRKFSKFLFPLKFALFKENIKLGKEFIAYGLPIIEIAKGSKITIGERVVFCSLSKNTALGVSKPIIIRTMNSNATVEIGNDVGLSGTTICAMIRISIGNNCLFGSDVTVFDNDFHPIEPNNRRYSKSGIAASPVKINDNVFIGTKVIIMKGVTIGENSVIGAGSVVVSNIPANMIAAGNPCKVLKSI